ncbi:Double-stranded RNA-binding domain [Lasallia pustulata]|uniref:Double-stranded RNA-binding domain n=1 Tax=Lasallia pustulata TaxID=136370 RepID=A0A1W5D147_9LECA|nr:Double-stranded RNA-binding domain [Lasallia pustulata]
MADLLRHLIVPGSPESFHTANSDKAPSPPASSETTEEAGLTSPRSENHCSTATVHTTALQAAGLPVYDIDEYLASPATQAVLDSSTDPTEPVQIGGPKTSHFVPLLNTLCQAKGLTPVYEILAQDGRFGAKLTVGGETVEREGTWTTKKEAREKLAECGVEVVRDLTPTAASAVTNGDNWGGSDADADKRMNNLTQSGPPDRADGPAKPIS